MNKLGSAAWLLWLLRAFAAASVRGPAQPQEALPRSSRHGRVPLPVAYLALRSVSSKEQALAIRAQPSGHNCAGCARIVLSHSNVPNGG